MLAVGNDIVWLRDPQNKNRAADTRLLNRIFSADERESIHASQDPERMIWTLWAAKESAYKVAAKISPRIFSPREFHVVFDTQSCAEASARKARVMTGDRKFSVLITQQEDYVYAIAANRDFSAGEVFSDVLQVSEEESSAETRRAAIAELGRNFRLEPASLNIVRSSTSKKTSFPRIEANGEPTAIDISLTHDGPFGAFAFPRQLVHFSARVQ